MIFETRASFRQWLQENGQTSEGIWLIFSKTKALKTLTANDALEEALCHGWIDGQMESIDDDTYKKYFAHRRPKSIWSEKNKALATKLIEQGLITLPARRTWEKSDHADLYRIDLLQHTK